MRKLGWLPDPHDPRDLKLKVSRIRCLPNSIDLRPKCSTIENQEDIGSCTAQSCVAAMEYLDRVQDDKWTDLSRLFVYYNSRDDKTGDTGAYIRDVIKTLSALGACDETLHPYIPKNYAVKPSSNAYNDALKRRITEYRRVDSLRGIRQSLADGYPVIFGFMVPTGFESSVGSDGIMPLPAPDEGTVGGHCCIIVGYDDKKKLLTIRNSWGKGWGDGGYFYMPYSFISDDITCDMWTITRTPHPSGSFDFGGEDVKWYIPITGIWDVIKKLLGKGGK